MRSYQHYKNIMNKICLFDGMPLLIFRLILAPVLIIAGFNKLQLNSEVGIFEKLLADPNVVLWFGNTQWGLGLPYPDLLAFLAGWTEFLGGWLILIGLLTRLISIPLIFTMLVAAYTVHLEHGWFSITPTNPQTSAAKVLNWLDIPGASESLRNSQEASERLSKMKSLIEKNGHPNYLYEKGNIVILNNGVEFAIIYLSMLLTLLFYGGGRFVSLDYFLGKKFEVV